MRAMTSDSVLEKFGNQSGMAIISEWQLLKSGEEFILPTQSKHFSGSEVQIFIEA